jgi:NADH:ubiquinone oxidoreductase subunit E
MYMEGTGFYTFKECHKTESVRNPPLQPLQKENGWETKETLERTAVTLETERAKWPNP